MIARTQPRSVLAVIKKGDEVGDN